MSLDEDIEANINEIKSIVEEYLNRISDSLDKSKTLDELIKGLNRLIGPSIPTRNLQQSISFFETFFLSPGLRGNEEALTISEAILDRLRELEINLESRISTKYSKQQVNENPSRTMLLEKLLQEIKSLKEMIEDIESQTQGYTDRTNSYGTNYPVDFIILSAYNIRKSIKRNRD